MAQPQNLVAENPFEFSTHPPRRRDSLNQVGAVRAIERSLIDHASLVVERDEFIAANFAFACCARVDQSIDRQETVRTLGDMHEIA